MPVTPQRFTASSNINRIVQGENIAMTVEIFDEVSKQVMNLAGALALSASFAGTPDEDGAATVVTVTMVDDEIEVLDDGRIKILLTESKTSLLKTGDQLSWQIEVEQADETVRIIQLLESLEVAASLF